MGMRRSGISGVVAVGAALAVGLGAPAAHANSQRTLIGMKVSFHDRGEVLYVKDTAADGYNGLVRVRDLTAKRQHGSCSTSQKHAASGVRTRAAGHTTRCDYAIPEGHTVRLTAYLKKPHGKAKSLGSWTTHA